MAITSNQVTITTSPTPINNQDPDGTYMYIKVMGNDTIYLGGASVTSETGLEIENDDGIVQIFLGPAEILYGVTEEETGKVCYVMTLKQ